MNDKLINESVLGNKTNLVNDRIISFFLMFFMSWSTMLVKNFLVLLIVAKTVFCKYEYIEELFNELKDEDGPCPGYLSNITKKLWAIKSKC